MLPVLNLPGLLGVAVLYLGAYFVAVRQLGLIRAADSDDLQLLAIGRMEKVVRVLSRRQGSVRKPGEKTP
jgi:hypothetical protein